MENKNLLYYVFSLVRLLLYPFALLYGALVWLRNRMYDGKMFTSIEFSVPVIAVGNLSTGGTGKTPHVEYLVRLMEYRYQAATMSRGYKRHSQGFMVADANSNALRIGDEPMQYHMKYPDLVVSVAEERMIGIPALLQRRPDIDVIILDDAYQHRSVKAGLSILITDYSRPFYTDHILPFGSLREGRSAYQRAHMIVVSKCPQDLTPEQAGAIEQQIRPLPHQKVFFTGIQYEQPVDLMTGELVALAGKSVILVCGIARPEPMMSFVKQHAADMHTLTYKDHHYFVSADLEEIKETYENWQAPDKIILTTEKDAARLHLHADKLRAWGIIIAVLPININVMFGKGYEFDGEVIHYIDRTITENEAFFGGGPGAYTEPLPGNILPGPAEDPQL